MELKKVVMKKLWIFLIPLFASLIASLFFSLTCCANEKVFPKITPFYFHHGSETVMHKGDPFFFAKNNS